MKGFANTSMNDLTKATGLSHRTVQKTFGTKQEIVRATIRFHADTEASLAFEPLRTAATGREAILSMLEENVRLCGRWPRPCGCLFTLNAFIIPSEDAELQGYLTELRRALAKQVRTRLQQSVSEGELGEDANIEALTNLCLTVLSGLTFRVVDGTRALLLFRCIELFVNGLGFRSIGINRATGRNQPSRNKTIRKSRNQ